MEGTNGRKTGRKEGGEGGKGGKKKRKGREGRKGEKRKGGTSFELNSNVFTVVLNYDCNIV